MDFISNIGKKIKRLRYANSLTQEELANRADLTKGFISQLERSLTSPTVITLKQILDVLGVSLSNFFSETIEERVVFRKSERILTVDTESNLKIELLIPGAQNLKMDPVLVTLNIGDKTFMEEPHEGEEFGFVIKGTVTLTLDKKSYRIEKGDCFYFKSDKEHFVENNFNKPAKILWLVSPPVFNLSMI